MSGGHFDYRQFQLEDMATQIEYLIDTNNIADAYGGVRNYRASTLARFRQAADALRLAGRMATRVDWLVSGDDGEDSFHRQWEEDFGENPQEL